MYIDIVSKAICLQVCAIPKKRPNLALRIVSGEQFTLFDSGYACAAFMKSVSH